MRKLVTLAALAVVIAAPASAQQDDRWPGAESRPRDIESRIDRIHQRIERASMRGRISRDEAEDLHREADAIAELHEDDRGDGFEGGRDRALAQRMRALRDRLRRDPREGGMLRAGDRAPGLGRMDGEGYRYDDQGRGDDAEWGGGMRDGDPSQGYDDSSQGYDDPSQGYPPRYDQWEPEPQWSPEPQWDAGPQGAESGWEDRFDEDGWERERWDDDRGEERPYQPLEEEDGSYYGDEMPPY